MHEACPPENGIKFPSCARTIESLHIRAGMISCDRQNTETASWASCNDLPIYTISMDQRHMSTDGRSHLGSPMDSTEHCRLPRQCLRRPRVSARVEPHWSSCLELPGCSHAILVQSYQVVPMLFWLVHHIATGLSWSSCKGEATQIIQDYFDCLLEMQGLIMLATLTRQIW
jgi:hypothetical protein